MNNEKSVQKIEHVKENFTNGLIERISDGYDNTMVSDNSKKSILTRGCDPEMGKRAIKILKPFTGEPRDDSRN